jgi:signal transduction histidine kinase
MLTNKLINKYLSISILAVFTVIFIEILSPFIIDSSINNSQVEFKEREAKIFENVQQNISRYEDGLTVRAQDIKQKILETKTTAVSDFVEILDYNGNTNYSINIFKTNQLVGWNKDRIVDASRINQLLAEWGKDRSFFYETSLFIYLASILEVDSIQIFTAVPVQKKYELKNSYYQSLSLTDVIEEEFDASVQITFDSTKFIKPSLEIKNRSGSTIGSIRIIEISKNSELQKFSENMIFLQSVFIIVAIIFFLFWLSSKFKSQNYIFGIIYFSISLIIIRIVFSLLNIVEYFGFLELNNPIYFSSTFAFGLTKSPLELFVTVITILIISAKIFFTFSKNLKLEYLSRTAKFFLSFLFSLLLILLYNGFASTLKSVIFDSSILYFKDASLFANYQTTFMYLNMLLIGLSIIFFSVVFVSVLVKLNDIFIKFNKYIQWLFLFSVLLVFVLIDELVFVKSSVVFSILFLIASFGLSYFWIYSKNSNLSKIITLLFSSSILSISFLNFFNTELEINSLKIIANELTRSNIELYEYYVEDALRKVDREELLSEKIISEKYNLDAEAFLLWTKTSLASEVQGSAINIIDKNRNLIGNFEFRYSRPYTWDWDENFDNDKPQHKISPIAEDSPSKTVSAITPIKSGNEIVGFVEIIAIYNAYKLENENTDILVSSGNPFKKLSVNLDLLKIFEFRNDSLTNYFTNIFLTKTEEEAIRNSSLSTNNDAWISLDLNNENNIFYLKKSEDKNGQKIIAVGLRDRDITWNLFDFFKVFFIHSIMILFVLLISVLMNYKSWKNIRISFKTKILISLLIISIIPLIILAYYFKQITDEKNSEAINYKLGKRADNVEVYLKTYLNPSFQNAESVFNKAAKDLGINYSFYENENLIFSSEGSYYRIELLPLILSPKAFLAINRYGMKEVILDENIDNYKFNSIYFKSNIVGGNYTIKISSLFNYYQLPMTGIELNVFLIGTYSLAIIFIIVLSTILANQISSPIEKLTKATRSVSRGDMAIQLQSTESGEIGELIDGFNLMVRELKKNQLELAEVERESAWREMAKQVAHEIKNPLTPMKLAVQHLVAAHKDKSPKYNSIFDRVTSTIIVQIDTLKNIASEFSNFAKMPSLKLEEIDIVSIINDTIDLFIDEQCIIKVISEMSSFKIKSDKEQFQRMIINLIRNSIQANGKEITISVTSNDNKAILFISDNGVGIKNEILPSIFEENFTTKKTGMGLGLALTKRFLNQTHGEISVDHTSPNGTTIKIILNA